MIMCVWCVGVSGCVRLGTRMLWHVYGGQRTHFKRRFFPSTVGIRPALQMLQPVLWPCSRYFIGRKIHCLLSQNIQVQIFNVTANRLLYGELK